MNNDAGMKLGLQENFATIAAVLRTHRCERSSAKQIERIHRDRQSEEVPCYVPHSGFGHARVVKD
jgi:hypothetical protein